MSGKLTAEEIWGSFLPDLDGDDDVEYWQRWHATWTAEDQEMLEAVVEKYNKGRTATVVDAECPFYYRQDDTFMDASSNCPMCKRMFTGHKRECAARFQLPSPHPPPTLTTARCACEMTSCGDVVLPYCLAPCGHSVCWDCLLSGNGECVVCCVAVSGIVLNAGLCQICSGGDGEIGARCNVHRVDNVHLPIEYVCESDNSLLCSKCVVESHTGPDHMVWKLFAGGGNSKRNNTLGMLLLSSEAWSLDFDINSALTRALSALKSAKEKREAMLERKSSLIGSFEKRMDDLIALIEAHKAKVIGELTAGFDEGLGLLTAKIGLLSTNMSQLGAATISYAFSSNSSESLPLTLTSLKAMQGLVDSVKSCDDWVSNVPSSSTCTLIDSVSLTGCVESALACMSVVVKDESYDDIDGVIVPGLASLKASAERTVERWQLIRSLKQLRYHRHNDCEGDASSEGNHKSHDMLAAAFQTASVSLASNGEVKMSGDDRELFLAGSEALCEAVIGLCGMQRCVGVDWSVFGAGIGLIDVATLLLKLMSPYYRDVEKRLVCSRAATALCSVLRSVTNIDEVRVLFEPEQLCLWVEDSGVASAVVSMLVKVCKAMQPVISLKGSEAAVRKNWLPFASGLFKVISAHSNKHDTVLSALDSLLHMNRIYGVNVIGEVSDAVGATHLMLSVLRTIPSRNSLVASLLYVLSELLAVHRIDTTEEAASIRVVVGVMESNILDGRVIVAACNCLSALLSLEDIAWYFQFHERLRAFCILTDLLSLHKTSEVVITYVFAALFSMAGGRYVRALSGDDYLFIKTEVWWLLGTTNNVLDCLRAWPRSRGIQQIGWNVIAILVDRLSSARNLRGRTELIDRACQVIDDHLAIEELQACWLGSEFCYIIDLYHSVQRAHNARDAHPENAEIQDIVCRVLEDLGED